jgi:hypothetical protein
LKGYEGTNLQGYFDELHHTNKEAIKTLDHSFNCSVVFKIGADSNIYDFRIIEVPTAPLNDIARNYIKNLFANTNGKWTKPIGDKSSEKNKLVFFIKLIKSNQDEIERMREDSKFTEFMISELFPIINNEHLSTVSEDYYLVFEY